MAGKQTAKTPRPVNLFDPTAVRQGATAHGARWVLILSLLSAAVTMAVIGFTVS